MTTTERTDWAAVAGKLGPIFAERAARHDSDDSFVAENYADLRASRAFAAGVPAGTLLMTSAVYADPTDGPTVLHFPLPLQAEGVKIVETWRTLGMRATGSHDVVVEGARIAASAIGGRRAAGKWHPLFHLVAMIALPIVYSVYVGIAEAARDLAVRQVARKKNEPDTQCLVGEIENQLRTAQIALDSVLDISRREKPGPETTNEVLIRRTIIGQACVRTLDKAMEAVGGAAFYRSLGLERLFRDVQGARFHPLSEKAQTRFSGRIALGVDIDD